MRILRTVTQLLPGSVLRTIQILPEPAATVVAAAGFLGVREGALQSLGNVDPNMAEGTFGKVTSTLNPYDARKIQLGIRVSF